MENEELIKKNNRLHTYHIIADIILIMVLIGISIYVIREVEIFKLLGKDVCKMCVEKTGAVCTKLTP